MISQKSKYALKALIVLAEQYGKGPILIANIAEREHIPRSFLELILLELKNHRFLDSRKGRGGGYFLAKPPTLISAGQAGSHGVHLLALILAIMVTAIPLFFGLWLYVPRRVRLIYDMRGVHVTLRRALARPGLEPQMLEILAGRAIYTMPYNRLLEYSRNPAEDWYLHRFEPLARAELERHGLSVERYFGERPALEA